MTSGILFFHSYKNPNIRDIMNAQMTPWIKPLNDIANANNKLVMMQAITGETYCLSAC